MLRGAHDNPTVSLPSSLTFTGKTVTGGTFAGATLTDATSIYSAAGSVAAPNNTPTTLFTSPSSQNAFYRVMVQTRSSGGGTLGCCVADIVVTADYGGGVVFNQASVGPGFLSLTMGGPSGLTLQATQTYGATKTLIYAVLRIGA